ncbi:MAG: tripartite tricarboxylate transporter TctB family protein [Rubrivivax sp.]|nr:tripartite tricarboxylate transporter TctB family protein [Rubrivivax sp.]
MDDPSKPGGGEPAGLNQRGPEIAVALLLAAVAVLVIVDSLRVGTGWADDGPRSGYFPFYIGLILLGASAWTLVNQLLRWSRTQTVFAEHAQLRMVMAMAVPVAVYVAAMTQLGLYVSSIALIAYFMRRHGRYGWAPVAAVSLGVPAVVFLVFERWFLVPLPKGPLERWLGM